MANRRKPRRKPQPFNPGQPADPPPILIREADEQGSSDDWTPEALDTLRRLAHAGPGCQAFVVIAFDAPSREIPGYQGFGMNVGTNMEPDNALNLLQTWARAELADKAGAN